MTIDDCWQRPAKNSPDVETEVLGNAGFYHSVLKVLLQKKCPGRWSQRLGRIPPGEMRKGTEMDGSTRQKTDGSHRSSQ